MIGEKAYEKTIIYCLGHEDQNDDEMMPFQTREMPVKMVFITKTGSMIKSVMKKKISLNVGECVLVQSLKKRVWKHLKRIAVELPNSPVFILNNPSVNLRI